MDDHSCIATLYISCIYLALSGQLVSFPRPIQRSLVLHAEEWDDQVGKTTYERHSPETNLMVCQFIHLYIAIYGT